MQYKMKHPATEAEAIDIINSAVSVLYNQIEYYRGDRKRSWNGDFVDHVKTEAIHALGWLALTVCHPPPTQVAIPPDPPGIPNPTIR